MTAAKRQCPALYSFDGGRFRSNGIQEPAPEYVESITTTITTPNTMIHSNTITKILHDNE